MIQKKKNTWHKNKTAQKRKTSPETKKVAAAKHWVVSQAKLVKIMEAAGMQPQKPTPMLPRTHDR